MLTLRSLALCALLGASALPAVASRGQPWWWRAPLLPQVFHFSGEITPTVLRDGVKVETDNNVPASWLGGEIHGAFTLIPDRAEKMEGLDTFEWTNGVAEYGRSGNWFTLSITNPDGSIFTMPADAPGPSPMGPDSSGRFLGDTGEDWDHLDRTQASLEVERTFSNASFEQAFRLDLATTFAAWPDVPQMFSFPFSEGWGGGRLLSVQVDASEAGYTNVGSLSQVAANGQSYAYSFTINRLVHMAPVPEPGTWALLMAGVVIAGVGARRRARSPG